MSRRQSINKKPTDAAVIDAFQGRMRKVNETRIIRDGQLSVSTSIEWHEGGDLVIQANEPDVDDWRSLFVLIGRVPT